MNTLADVFRVINTIKSEELIREYALGGAAAVLFYAEPARTYDVDVFVVMGATAATTLLSLQSLYDWARSRGFTTEGEHIVIHGVPVQFLLAHNALAEEAVAAARTLLYMDVPVRVIGPEHLVALALQAGGAQRRERAWQLLESGSVDRAQLRAVLAAHGISADIPDEEQ